MPTLSLQKREKIALALGGIGVALILAYYAAQGPIKTYKRSEQWLVGARESLGTALLWRDQILADRSGQEAIRKRLQERGRFDLWTFVDRTIRDTELQEQAKLQTSPMSSGNLAEVILVLNDVNLVGLVDLLHRIYDGDNLVILRKMDYLRVDRRDSQGLECRMTFLAPKAL